MPDIFRRTPQFQARRRSYVELHSTGALGVVDTTFTASASFQATINTTFTASSSFATVVSTTFTASASFATVVNTTFTASASFSALVSTTFTASASFFSLFKDTTFTASASFVGTAVANTTFTAAASFARRLDTTFTASASFSAADSQGVANNVFTAGLSTESFYEIRLVHPSGYYLNPIDDYLSLEYTMVVNDVGVMTMVLPGTYSASFFAADYRFEIWRGIDGGALALEGNTQWLIQEITRSVDDSGNRTLKLVAYDLKHILKRRIVAYLSGSGLTGDYNVGACDDMMKSLFNRNYGSAAIDATRNISSSITFDTAIALAPVSTLEFAKQNILETMQKIATLSYELGTPLYFDVIATTPPAGLVFITYITQRGIDRRASSGNALRLGYADGNIGAYDIIENYDEEITYVYAGGPGDDDLRLLSTQEDTARSGRSVFGRKEVWIDEQEADTQALLDAEAQAALSAGRVRKVFTGKLLNTPGALYGRDWQFGDYVTVGADDESFDCIIAALHVTVSDNGKEVIDAALRSV